MRILKLLLWILTSALLVLLILFAGALYWSMSNPDQVLSIIERQFLPRDINIQWDQMEWKFYYPGGLGVGVRGAANGVRIENNRPSLVAPIDHIDFDIAFRPLGDSRVIIHELSVNSRKTILMKIPSADKRSSQPSNLDDKLSFLKWIKFANTLLNFQRIKLLRDNSEPIDFSFKASMKNEGPLRFQIGARYPIPQLGSITLSQLENACRCTLPEKIRITAVGEARPKNLLEKNNAEVELVRANLTIDSIVTPFLKLTLGGDLVINYTRDKLKFLPHLNSELLIHDFQAFRRTLDRLRILVPAPLDVLHGQVHLTARGPLLISPQIYKFAGRTHVDLSSQRQKVELRNQISVELDRSFKFANLHVQNQIHNLWLELPPLDPLAGQFRVFPNQRIIRRPKDTKNSTPTFSMAVTFSVETTRPGAIRLYWPPFVPYLPITVDAQYGSNSGKGYVRAEPFQIVYLRRKMDVQKMNIDLDHAERDVFAVDGRIRMEQTHYTVYVDLGGRLSRPNIQLSSDPYLPEDEILSVLLFDRTSDQLISADAETTGSVRAALADRAIGLLGLWAFASTPIRSFHYNPAAKSYTATVALADDTSVAIGTDWEQTTHFELRKRLSRRWIATATWTPATQDDERSTRFVLQWEQRFQ